jgi:hypothetical protein
MNHHHYEIPSTANSLKPFGKQQGLRIAIASPNQIRIIQRLTQLNELIWQRSRMAYYDVLITFLREFDLLIEIGTSKDLIHQIFSSHHLSIVED